MTRPPQPNDWPEDLGGEDRRKLAYIDAQLATGKRDREDVKLLRDRRREILRDHARRYRHGRGSAATSGSAQRASIGLDEGVHTPGNEEPPLSPDGPEDR